MSAARTRAGARVTSLLVATWALIALLASACGETRIDGLDAQSLPADVRPDYAVFAQRCSKCHSLARPLNSGIDDDDYWASYVAKMRRQPESGISPEDARVILRFLHYFSIQERAKHADTHARTEPIDAAAPAVAPDGGP